MLNDFWLRAGMTLTIIIVVLVGILELWIMSELNKIEERVTELERKIIGITEEQKRKKRMDVII